jgi:hypothetical protein
MEKMYTFLQNMGIVVIEWEWTEIERRAWRYAKETTSVDVRDY